MRLLRDLREATRLLILLETSTRHHAVQRTIAEALGITVQGASEYLRSMEEDGLVQVTEGEYRPTIEGIRILHERFRELRDFVDRAGKELSIIDVTAAIAGGRIEQGDSVGLFMDRGDLVAYPSRNSPSRGQAVSRAERGEDVGVTRLEGIVALTPGRISLLRMPAASEGGSHRVDGNRARRTLTRVGADVVAILDAPAKALATRLRISPDIRFGATSASIEAAERGVDVALILPEDRVAAVVAAIEGANERRVQKIPYETVPLA